MKVLQLCVFVAGFVAVWGTESGHPEPVHPSVQEDAQLSMQGLVNKYGYPLETYNITTSDGYFLTIYRIPFGKKCGPSTGKTPVLLQHGLLSSSFDFVILGPEKSLGYLLADVCYDVWIGNNRGNSECRHHVKLTTKNSEFWKFSWHEMGKYDLPAITDFILEKTAQPSLHYVGHSQGTTQFFVFAALHPEYHHKIRSMHALSPVAYMKNLASPFAKFLALFHKSLEFVAELIGLHEFLPVSKLLNFLGANICRDKYPHLQMICSNVMFLLTGFDEPQLNKTILPAIIGHTPAGASSKQFAHYAQGIQNGHFRHYDFGIIKNLIVYKSIFPPEYDLTNVNIPIAFYYGTNDWLAAIKDVKTLESKLPNIIEKYQVPFSKFNHLDFLYAKDVVPLLYERVIDVMNKYN